MSEPLVRHETFEYRKDAPFHIFNICLEGHDRERMLNHWHEELEEAYVITGKSRHYIDGECVEGGPGRLIVMNPGSVHNIIPDDTLPLNFYMRRD